MRRSILYTLLLTSVATWTAPVSEAALAPDGFLLRRHTLLEGFDQQTGAPLEIDEVFFRDGLYVSKSSSSGASLYVRARASAIALAALQEVLARERIGSLTGSCSVPVVGPSNVTGLSLEITWFGDRRQHSLQVGDSSKFPLPCPAGVLRVLGSVDDLGKSAASDPGLHSVRTEP